MTDAELEARVSLARIRTRAMDRNDGKASAMDDRDDLLARLDAAEAREQVLREAVDLAYRWVDFTPEGVDGLRSRMRRALAEALAREAQGYPSEWAYSAERIRRYLREAGVHLVTAEAEAVARVLRELADEVAEIHDDYNKTGESGWIGRSDVIGLIAAKAEAEGVKL